MGLADIPKRTEAIRAFKNNGGQIAAVLPIHYPRALFRAFNILPVEVWGPPKTDVSLGGAHLQPYVCSIVHNALSFLKNGGLEIADYIMVPHACDSLQGLGSILLDFVKPRQAVLPLYLPRGQRKDDIRFLAQELEHIYRRLSELCGKRPSDETLRTCIQREEQADAWLRELYNKRGQLGVSTLAFYRLVRSREYVPAEVFSQLAEQTLKQRGRAESAGIPVLLSGIVPEPMEVLQTIEDAGGVVMADDLACCGRRLYRPGSSENPFERMAERIVSAPPDPTRGNSIEEREDHLLQLARKTGARGVIFYDVKFCEPELFDLPSLRANLKKAGLHSVNIEIDINDPLPNQVVTRIGAFLEILE